MRRLVVLFCWLGFCGLAHSDILTQHASIYIQGSGSGVPSTYYESSVTGNYSAMNSGSGSGNGNGNQTASSSGLSQNNMINLINLSTNSTSDNTGEFVPAGRAIAVGTWRDIITVSGSSPLGEPTALRMRYSVTASFSGTQGSLGSFFGKSGYISNISFMHGQTSDLINGYINYNEFNGVKVVRNDWESGSAGVVNSLSVNNFISNNSNSSSFSGTFQMDVTEKVGNGFGWSLVASMGTESWDGSGNTVLNGLQLESISAVYSDGSVVGLGAGSVSFDSGIIYSPVPEPGTILLTGSALALGVGCSWFRRKKELASSEKGQGPGLPA